MFIAFLQSVHIHRAKVLQKLHIYKKSATFVKKAALFLVEN